MSFSINETLLEPETQKRKIDVKVPEINHAEQLLVLIKKGDFRQGLQYLRQNHLIMDKLYQDEKSNTVVHVFILSLIQSVLNEYKFQKPEASLDLNQVNFQNIENIMTSAFNLLKELVTLSFNFNTRNSDGYRPGDFFKEVKGQSFFAQNKLRELEQTVTQIFADFGDISYPGRKYVSKLSCYRGSKKGSDYNCQIPDLVESLNIQDGLNLNLHQRLELVQTHYQRKYALSNVVVFNFGIIISDKENQDPGHRRVFVSVPLYDNNIEVKRSNGHSEQGLKDYLCDENNLKKKIDLFKDRHAQLFKAGHKIYNVIFDICSTREVCRDCEAVLYDMQCSMKEDGFLFNLEKLLVENGFILPDKDVYGLKYNERDKDKKPRLKTIIRVSGFQEPGFDGNLSLEYPGPIILSENLDVYDIRSLSVKTMLHLVPKWGVRQSGSDIFSMFNTSIFGTEEYTKMEKLFNARDVKLLSNTDNFKLVSYTAFANRGDRSKKIGDIKRKSLDTLSLDFESIKEWNLKQFSFK